MEEVKKIGTFYGVGVGPGDPELMTLKSLKVIKASGVIAVPSSALPPEPGNAEKIVSRALQVVRGAVSLEGKEVVALHLPMTRDPDVLRTSREKAAAVLADRLGSGQDVAFVTIGDPMLYSTFGYLAPLVSALLPGVRIVVIPGVSSISAAASLTCSPIAQSDEKVIIVPAAYSVGELRQWLKTFDTVVLMKVNKSMDMLVDLLGETGLERSAIFASRVGWPDEEIITDIGSLKGKRPDYFSMVIIRTGVS